MRYLAAAAALLLGGYLLTGLVQVQPGERAVVRRFGRVVATPGPGLWVGLPWPIDRVDRVPVDLVRRVAFGFEPAEESENPAGPAGQFLTGDHNLVNVRAIVHYTVAPDGVVRYVEQAARADELIARAAEAAVAEWVAGRGIDEVLVEGKTVLPEVVVSQTQARIDPYGLGVRVQAADVAHLYPPDEVKHAFEEVTRAETSIRTREHEARQEAARLFREAQTRRRQLETETEAYVTAALRRAQAEADAFLARLDQLQRAPKREDYLASIWWDEIGRLLSRLKDGGRVDLLDQHLAGDGLDITVFPPRKK